MSCRRKLSRYSRMWISASQAATSSAVQWVTAAPLSGDPSTDVGVLQRDPPPRQCGRSPPDPSSVVPPPLLLMDDDGSVFTGWLVVALVRLNLSLNRLRGRLCSCYGCRRRRFGE